MNNITTKLHDTLLGYLKSLWRNSYCMGATVEFETLYILFLRSRTLQYPSKLPWNVFKAPSYGRNSKLKWNVEKMAALISATCHSFPSHSSLFASFRGNEPNDISNNAKINMAMKMFLHSPFIFLFMLLWVCFLSLSSTATLTFFTPDGISPHPYPRMCNVCIWI